MNLERFVDAQEHGRTYAHALAEIRAARKRTHWMWFVFPQVAGLGMSPTSQHFAIGGLAEARAYLEHPVLGVRLRECVRALLELDTGDAEGVFGSVDAMKLRSSLTLFLRAAPDGTPFAEALDKFFSGRPDPMTDQILGQTA